MNKLTELQKKLNVPKTHRNNFGNYNYRNCEDILEAVKPLLEDDMVLTISDEIVNIGERYYVKATVTLKVGQETYQNTAYARESDEKKGQDQSQITGASSSYARKYALNGLFLIDDTKDADYDTKQVENTPTSRLDTKNDTPRYEPIAQNLVCEMCKVNVPENVANFSKSRYKQVLCRDCQKKVNP